MTLSGFTLCNNDPVEVSTEHRAHLRVLHRSGQRYSAPGRGDLTLHLTPGSTNTDPTLTPIQNNIQQGARYTSTLINALMESSSWDDSAFIFTFDESGGLYDHVAPQPTVSPDGIAPVDLPPGDICTAITGPTMRFRIYRLSHTLDCHFAICQEELCLPHSDGFDGHPEVHRKAVQSAALTKRDAAQPDMTEFFDFNNPPWMTPPTPPQQNISNPCYLNKVP